METTRRMEITKYKPLPDKDLSNVERMLTMKDNLDGHYAEFEITLEYVFHFARYPRVGDHQYVPQHYHHQLYHEGELSNTVLVQGAYTLAKYRTRWDKDTPPERDEEFGWTFSMFNEHRQFCKKWVDKYHAPNVVAATNAVAK